MANPLKIVKQAPPMSTLDVIYNRRAVRNYLPQGIDQHTIRALIDAAVHAPTAMHEEAWSFVVIQIKVY